jgi:hypothetical protein
MPVTQEPTVFLPVAMPGPAASTSVGPPVLRSAPPPLPEEQEDFDTFLPAEGEESDNISPEGQCSQEPENSSDPRDTDKLEPLPPRKAKLNVDFRKYF